MGRIGDRGARLRIVLVALAMSLVIPLGSVASAHAAEDRAQLRAMISDARGDLQATAAELTGLTKEDRRFVRVQLDRLRADASDASAALSAARGQAALTRVATQVKRLSSRSRSLLESTRIAVIALRDLAQA